MQYFFAAYILAKRDIQTGSQVGRQTANMLVCMRNVFEFCVCVFMPVCQCLREKAFESASLLPGGKAFISYLQAQTGALIFSHIFLTPLCSPTPDGHYSAPYRSDYLRKQCCEVKTLWSQAGNTEPEKPSLIVKPSFSPQIKTHLNLDNWGDDGALITALQSEHHDPFEMSSFAHFSYHCCCTVQKS